MAEDFVQQIANQLNLLDEEVMVLRTADVRSFEDLDSLIHDFPTIHTLGVRIPYLSAMASPRVSQSYARAKARRSAGGRPPAIHGALHPPRANWAPGTTVPIPPSLGSAKLGAPTGPITLPITSWPVRNQGQRGTCVSFAATACAEHKQHQASSTGPLDHSEQFLYWAIKTKTADPSPKIEGTYLEFARDALANVGICLESHWPYVPTYMPNNVSHSGNGNPSPNALGAAARNTHNSATYQVFTSSGQGAAWVLAALQTGRPVAISLPVFRDPHSRRSPDNWTTNSGLLYGRVISPPPTAVVTSGHAVCIVGFVPDAIEPMGGYFIFRNSWGTQWASLAPSHGNSNSPAPGYGEVAATYVDNYLWELLQF